MNQAVLGSVCFIVVLTGNLWLCPSFADNKQTLKEVALQVTSGDRELA